MTETDEVRKLELTGREAEAVSHALATSSLPDDLIDPARSVLAMLGGERGYYHCECGESFETQSGYAGHQQACDA